MKEIIVTKAEAGQRFDRYLKKYMPEAASGLPVGPEEMYRLFRKMSGLSGKRSRPQEKEKSPCGSRFICCMPQKIS